MTFMRTGQNKILDDLASIVESFGYEPVWRREYANIGTVAVQHRERVEEYAQIDYDFDTPSMTFRLTVEGVRILSQPPRMDYFDFTMKVVDTTAYQAFRTRVVEELQALRARKQH